MNTHNLKTDPAVFAAVLDGTKTYELRKNDRDFAVGDALVLHETRFTGEEMAAGQPLEYTTRSTVRYISHCLHGPIYGLQEGCVLLSFEAPLAATLDMEKEYTQDAPTPAFLAAISTLLSTTAPIHTIHTDKNWLMSFCWNVAKMVMHRVNARRGYPSNANTIYIQGVNAQGDESLSHIRSTSNCNEDVHVMTGCLELSQAAGRGVQFEPHTIGNLVVQPKPSQGE